MNIIHNMNNKHQFSGKNLEEALNEAAKYFSVDKAFVCYNALSKTQGGLFSKIFSRGVQIEAWLETAKEDLQEAARKAVREAMGTQKTPPSKNQPTPQIQYSKQQFTPQRSTSKKPFDQERNESLNRTFIEIKEPKTRDLLTKYNELFFSAFSLSNENYSTEINENNAIVHVEDEFLEEILTRSDKLSLAYEHVFKRIAQKKLGDISGRLSLDAGSSIEKREERLIGVAKNLAEKVRKTGRSVILTSKSSQERRIIHLALDGFEGVGTRSVGMGEKRRLVIFSLEKNNSTEQRTKNNSRKPGFNKRKTTKSPSQKKNIRSNEKPANINE